MVLCRAFLLDLGHSVPDDLLGPLGLTMYSISTHDDIVDEQPGREDVAGLLYAGNIASLHGIAQLVSHGYSRIAQRVIHLMNLNHCFQRDIISSIWMEPSSEAGYLKAISHTGYWAAIGTAAAAEYIFERGALTERRIEEVTAFALEFGRLYGQMCQLYDDVREIDDDLRNGYFSLPISIALNHGYDLGIPEDRSKAIARPKEIAEQNYLDISVLCDDEWPALSELSERMHTVGQRLAPK